MVPAQAQKELRRRGSNLELTTIEKSREWRGGNSSQPLEQIPAGANSAGAKPLRKVCLINMAGANVGLDSFDSAHKFRAWECRGNPGSAGVSAGECAAWPARTPALPGMVFEVAPPEICSRAGSCCTARTA